MAKDTGRKVESAVDENDDFVKENLGFLPYWDPGEGESFQGIINSLDITDEKFPRWNATLTKGSIRGCKGAKETDAYEEIEIMVGDQFSFSEWEGINRRKMVVYIGIEIKLTRGKETKIPKKPGQTFINWSLEVPRKSLPIIQQRKADLAAAQSANSLEA